MFRTRAALGAMDARRRVSLALRGVGAFALVAPATPLFTNLLTFVFGRGVEADDRRVVRVIMREAASHDRRSSIRLGIIKTKPFQFVQTRGA